VPLNFLHGPNIWKAGIVRDSIINAVGNIQRAEALSCKAQQDGKQNSKQPKKKTEILHRAQVQRLAALAAEHAQLCYNFKNHKLIFHNLHWTEDPTCCRALRGCSEEVLLLLLPSSISTQSSHQQPASPSCHCQQVVLARFNLFQTRIHTWIWQHATL
jgi:NAD-dependent SIR2 family protein deacetylase